MLRFFEIVSQTKKSVDELISMFPQQQSSPEFRLACPEEKKQQIIEELKNYFSQQDDISIITIDGIRVAFPFGWGIVRASNTQAVLSMRFESDTKDGLQKVMDAFYAILKLCLTDKDALSELLEYKEHI